jgi:hypothetical protein
MFLGARRYDESPYLNCIRGSRDKQSHIAQIHSEEDFMIRTIASLLLIVSVSAAAPAYSAAYMKFDGVKGESTQTANTPNQKVKNNNAAKPEPQKTKRASNSSDGAKGGNVEFEWKVEAGEK